MAVRQIGAAGGHNHLGRHVVAPHLDGVHDASGAGVDDTQHSADLGIPAGDENSAVVRVDGDIADRGADGDGVEHAAAPDIDDHKRAAGRRGERGVQPVPSGVDTDGVDRGTGLADDHDGADLAGLDVDDGDVGDIVSRTCDVHQVAGPADGQAPSANADLTGGERDTGVEIDGNHAVLGNRRRPNVSAVGGGDGIGLGDSGHHRLDPQGRNVDDRHGIVTEVGSDKKVPVVADREVGHRTGQAVELAGGGPDSPEQFRGRPRQATDGSDPRSRQRRQPHRICGPIGHRGATCRVRHIRYTSIGPERGPAQP